jgi:hypothetical protein
MPPTGAGPFRVTVPVTLLPPTAGLGERDRLAIQGSIVRFAEELTSMQLAVIVTVVAVETQLVVTGKVLLVCPAGTVTDAGTTARPELLLNPTIIPPAGAGPLSSTVPVDWVPFVLPPTTVGGLSVSEFKAGRSVIAADCELLCEPDPYVAVMVTTFCCVTAPSVMVKFALVWPAGTVTL